MRLLTCLYQLAESLRRTRLYRRWRNLDQLEAAQRAAREAQQAQEATLAQLTANRRLLATTMRERDRYRDALRRVTGELRRQRAKRHEERHNSRLWITRCTATNVREN